MNNTVQLWVASYFIVGLWAIIILDVTTKRIRRRFRAASVEAQAKLATTGNLIGEKSSMIVLLVALWLFWPAAIIGALLPKSRRE